MTSPERTPQSNRFAEIILWTVVGLFLALGIVWAVYPKIYLHNHPEQPWPVIPQRWLKYSASSPTLVYFFLACMTAGFGFLQTRLSLRFHRDSSRILTMLYLFASVVFLIGSWTFDVGSHFWTIPMQNDIYAPDRVLQTGRFLVKWGLYASLAAAVLNVNYSFSRQRKV